MFNFFKQEFTINPPSNEYVMEKVTLNDIKKGKIIINIKPGCDVIIPAIATGVGFPGKAQAYEFERERLTQLKGDSIDCFVCSKAPAMPVIKFFGGQHQVRLSQMKDVRGKFALVGTTQLEIVDMGDLANYFNKSVTLQDIENVLVNNGFKETLSNEVQAVACKYITDDSTEIDFSKSIGKMIFDIANGGKTAKILKTMGLKLSEKGTSMHVNVLDATEEISNTLNQAVLNASLYNVEKDKIHDQANLENEKAKIEIEKIKAEKANVTESTTNTNINSNVNLPNNTTVHTNVGRRFCPQCGNEIFDATSAFCNKCGHKL